jgi:ribonuclease HII
VVEAEAVVKGDAKVYCIAAASIIAKVTRDRCAAPRCAAVRKTPSLPRSWSNLSIF